MGAFPKEGKANAAQEGESDIPEKFLVEWVRYRAHIEEGALHRFKNLYLTITKTKEKIVNRSADLIAG